MPTTPSRRIFAERAHGRRLLRFGLEASADVTARDISAGRRRQRASCWSRRTGEAEVTLPLPGRHNVRNALAAAALALAAGAALSQIVAGPGRGAAGAGPAGRAPPAATARVLIDDSYNANPGSRGRRHRHAGRRRGGEAWLVLGDMRELGDDADGMHAEAGRRARSAGIARLFTLGPLSARRSARPSATARAHFDTARRTGRGLARCAARHARRPACACW